MKYRSSAHHNDDDQRDRETKFPCQNDGSTPKNDERVRQYTNVRNQWNRVNVRAPCVFGQVGQVPSIASLCVLQDSQVLKHTLAESQYASSLQSWCPWQTNNASRHEEHSSTIRRRWNEQHNKTALKPRNSSTDLYNYIQHPLRIHNSSEQNNSHREWPTQVSGRNTQKPQTMTSDKLKNDPRRLVPACARTPNTQKPARATHNRDAATNTQSNLITFAVRRFEQRHIVLEVAVISSIAELVVLNQTNNTKTS